MSRAQRRRRHRRSRLGKRGFVLAALHDFDKIADVMWACARTLDQVPIVFAATAPPMPVAVQTNWSSGMRIHAADAIFGKFLADAKNIRDRMRERLLLPLGSRAPAPIITGEYWANSVLRRLLETNLGPCLDTVKIGKIPEARQVLYLPEKFEPSSGVIRRLFNIERILRWISGLISLAWTKLKRCFGND